MSRPVPIYRDHGETYIADTCFPVAEAARRNEVELVALAHGHYPGARMPAGVLPGVKTVGYWDAGQPQQWGLHPHRNEGVELTFLESGSLAFSVNDRQYKLKPDDLTITRPWELHRVGNPYVSTGRLHWIIVDVGVRLPNQNWKWPEWLVLSKADRDELTAILRHQERAVWRGTPEIRRCFQAIAQGVENDRKGSSASRLAVRINDLFVLLLDLFRGQRLDLDVSLSSSFHTIQLFLDDLQAHDEHIALSWTLREMAASCNLGVTQFVEYVKRATNLTPMQFLNDCRLNLAARRLREAPEETILDIALECGFSSSQYFATVFTRRFGISPSQFRQSPANLGAVERAAERRKATAGIAPKRKRGELATTPNQTGRLK